MNNNIFSKSDEIINISLILVIKIILEKTIKKKTLYRRFKASNMFVETGEMVATGARAAMLYKLKDGVELVNFERNLG